MPYEDKFFDSIKLDKTPMPHSDTSSPQTSPKVMLEPRIMEKSDKTLIKLHPVPVISTFHAKLAKQRSNKQIFFEGRRKKD